MTVPSIERLRTRIFADGADVAGLLELAALPYIRGFTTNPTLMRKAGVADYRGFAREVLDQITDRPISFEVFSDEPAEMRAQAIEIASWGPNVYVKIPVTTTRGEPMTSLVRDLSSSGVQVNVTALMTERQVEAVSGALEAGAPSCVSVFAGRIADTGRDPLPIMCASLRTLAQVPSAELIWASPREVLNIMQADAIGCHIITVTYDLLAKLRQLGKDLDEFSLDTVRMFHDDAASAGFRLEAAEVGG
jgi:transaldolase